MRADLDCTCARIDERVHTSIGVQHAVGCLLGVLMSPPAGFQGLQQASGSQQASSYTEQVQHGPLASCRTLSVALAAASMVASFSDRASLPLPASACNILLWSALSCPLSTCCMHASQLFTCCMHASQLLNHKVKSGGEYLLSVIQPQVLLSFRQLILCHAAAQWVWQLHLERQLPWSTYYLLWQHLNNRRAEPCCMA